jgi:hypothetical protein
MVAPVSLLLVLEALVLMVFGAWQVFPAWAFILINWFVLALLIERGTKLGRLPTLPRPAKALHYLSMFAFPAIATLWKYIQRVRELDDGGIPNRLQHFGWALCTVGVLMPLFARWWEHRRLWERIAITTGVVALIGNVTELFEFINKFDRIEADYYHAEIMFKDTVADLIMNVLGAVVAAVIFHSLLRYRPRALAAGAPSRSTLP